MLVQECMTSMVHTIAPDSSLRAAAVQMGVHDLGSLPVVNVADEKLVGMVTDRDIVIRGLGCGKGPEALASDVMSNEVLYCRAGDEVDEVLGNMGENQVRRLPVVSDEKRLVGIVSLGDLIKADPSHGGACFAQITEPSDKHSQVLS